jgi:hypothetical protein
VFLPRRVSLKRGFGGAATPNVEADVLVVTWL